VANKDLSSEIHFKVRPTTHLVKLKKSYSERTGIPVNTLMFSFAGKPISDYETARELKMTNGDIIVVLTEHDSQVSFSLTLVLFLTTAKPCIFISIA
jgi:hypothetical protein